MIDNTSSSVITIPALGDNYIYLYPYENNFAFAVDPSDASVVFSDLKKHNLKLTDIFITHHHWDHTAAVGELKAKTGCKIIGADKKRISGKN